MVWLVEWTNFDGFLTLSKIAIICCLENLPQKFQRQISSSSCSNLRLKFLWQALETTNHWIFSRAPKSVKFGATLVIRDPRNNISVFLILGLSDEANELLPIFNKTSSRFYKATTPTGKFCLFIHLDNY